MKFKRRARRLCASKRTFILIHKGIRKKSKVVPYISHKAVKVRRRARRLCASKKTFILIHK